LGFVYNSTPEDLIYESPVPAIGYKLIQGPLVTSVPNDSAKFNDTWRKGYRNLQMTSFLFSVDNMFTFPRDPRLPGDVVYVKPYEVHDILRGRAYGSGFINPFNGSLCYFPLYGDPVSGEGWYEGNGWPGGLAPGNREIMINTGPFNMIPGDTQELVIAIIVAKGGNNLNSITDLKDKANLVQIFYNLFYPYPTGIKYETPIPEFFSLSQNYPNPFTPVTTIKYSLPVGSLVTLKVYDMLGNEISTLVNKEEEPDEYTVEFSADGLSSGIYFYTISARAFIRTKKMVVLK
jgi:hypothetical protein